MCKNYVSSKILTKVYCRDVKSLFAVSTHPSVDVIFDDGHVEHVNQRVNEMWHLSEFASCVVTRTQIPAKNRITIQNRKYFLVQNKYTVRSQNVHASALVLLVTFGGSKVTKQKPASNEVMGMVRNMTDNLSIFRRILYHSKKRELCQSKSKWIMPEQYSKTFRRSLRKFME